jgi:hypothetical protein
MDWRAFPLLMQRRNISPPAFQPLPPVTDIKQLKPQPLLPADYPNEDDDPFPVTLDDPDNLPDNSQEPVEPQNSLPTTVWQRTKKPRYIEPDVTN